MNPNEVLENRSTSPSMDAIEFLNDKLRSTKTNGEFFNSMSSGKN